MNDQQESDAERRCKEYSDLKHQVVLANCAATEAKCAAAEDRMQRYTWTVFGIVLGLIVALSALGLGVYLKLALDGAVKLALEKYGIEAKNTRLEAILNRGEKSVPELQGRVEVLLGQLNSADVRRQIPHLEVATVWYIGKKIRPKGSEADAIQGPFKIVAEGDPNAAFDFDLPKDFGKKVLGAWFLMQQRNIDNPVEQFRDVLDWKGSVHVAWKDTDRSIKGDNRVRFSGMHQEGSFFRVQIAVLYID